MNKNVTGNNIIKFPLKFVSEAPVTRKQSKACIENVRWEHIAEATDIFAEIFSQNISSAFFDLRKADPKTFILFIESLKSLLCSCYYLPHPLHEVSEKLFLEEDDGNYKFNLDSMKKTRRTKNSKKTSQVCDDI